MTMRRPRARPVARATHCRGCGKRHEHHLLFEPEAFHALARHNKVFCADCGGMAMHVPPNMATAS